MGETNLTTSGSSSIDLETIYRESDSEDYYNKVEIFSMQRLEGNTESNSTNESSDNWEEVKNLIS